MNLQIILLVFAFVFAVCATFNLGATRWSLGWAAFAFYLASVLFGPLHIGR